MAISEKKFPLKSGNFCTFYVPQNPLYWSYWQVLLSDEN
jgi:hypothetical protein